MNMILKDTQAFQALDKEYQTVFSELQLSQFNKKMPLSVMSIKNAYHESTTYQFTCTLANIKTPREVDTYFFDYEVVLSIHIINGIFYFYWVEKISSNDITKIPKGLDRHQKETEDFKNGLPYKAVIKIAGQLAESRNDFYLNASEAHLKFIDSTKMVSLWEGLHFRQYSKLLNEWISQLIKVTKSWKHHFFHQGMQFTTFDILPIIDKQFLFKSFKEYVQANYGALFYQQNIALYSQFMHLQILHFSQGKERFFHQCVLLFNQYYNQIRALSKDFILVILLAYSKQFKKTLLDFEKQTIFIFTYFYNFPFQSKARTIDDLITMFFLDRSDITLADLEAYETYYQGWKLLIGEN